jgi:hypothetical protein
MIDETLTKGLRQRLDAMTLGEVRGEFGPGDLRTTYVQPIGHNWKPGRGAPALVAETPAVAQAMGRCATSRSLKGDSGAMFSQSVHPGECGWCVYPLRDLLEALEHAVWRSQTVEAEHEEWRFAGGARYVRSTGRDGHYDNPEWRRFWTMSRFERAAEIAHAGDRT